MIFFFTKNPSLKIFFLSFFFEGGGCWVGEGLGEG